jgi:hypothetical protein
MMRENRDHAAKNANEHSIATSVLLSPQMREGCPEREARQLFSTKKILLP